MDAIALQREKIRQLKAVLPEAEPQEWPEIKDLISFCGQWKRLGDCFENINRVGNIFAGRDTEQ